MNFEQEKIIAELGDRSPGAPFLFVPNTYRIGKTVARSCDMAWVCSGGILLIHGIESGRSREKMARHNFNPLKTWYREWRAGRVLKGRNRRQAFDIPFDRYPHKVLLSVVRGGEATAEWNREIGRDLATGTCPSPTLCATIPQSVLAYIAAHGGSAVDLLHFLSALGGEPPLPEAAALKALRRLHNACYNFARPQEISVDFRTDPRRYALDPTCRMLQGGSAENSLVSFLLGDLGWSQTLQVLKHLKLLERTVSGSLPDPSGSRAAGTLLDLPPYLLGMVVSRTGSGPQPVGPNAAGEQAALLHQAILRHPVLPERFGILLRCVFAEGAPPTVSAQVVTGGDDTAIALQSQAAAALTEIQNRVFPVS